jgi:cyclopropane fatty-acyl-phospholipid synthase-like methyltransferase
MSVKSAIKEMPLIGPIINRLRVPKLVDSDEYWENRYRGGGHSGAGSYNRLAEFKAEILNQFVKTHEIEKVIEFGCGDGAQLALANYPSYIGTDVSQTVLEVCREKFAGKPYRFIHQGEASGEKAELSLSLDVLYHLTKDEVFTSYMQGLFDASSQWVIIYSSNKEWREAPHVRHRRFTRWIETNRLDFVPVDKISNCYPFDPADPENTSFADFYVYRRSS